MFNRFPFFEKGLKSMVHEYLDPDSHSFVVAWMFFSIIKFDLFQH